MGAPRPDEVPIVDGEFFFITRLAEYMILPCLTPLCVCGHLADHHADPAIGDTRCLVVDDRRDRSTCSTTAATTRSGYCACLSLPAGRPAQYDEQAS